MKPTLAELNQVTDEYIAAKSGIVIANQSLDLGSKRRIKSRAMSRFNKARAAFKRVESAIIEDRPVRASKRLCVDFESTVGAGLPVGVVVGHIDFGCDPSWDDPGEGESAEFEIVDTKGYPGGWIDRHITEADEIRIEVECLAWAHDRRMSALEDEADARVQEHQERMMECA